jgi:NAD-reducing hydrogenase small subunit
LDCHLSFLRMDGHLTELLEHLEFNRMPLPDIKYRDPCDIGLIKDSMCPTKNMPVLHHSSIPKTQ